MASTGVRGELDSLWPHLSEKDAEFVVTFIRGLIAGVMAAAGPAAIVLFATRELRDTFVSSYADPQTTTVELQIPRGLERLVKGFDITSRAREEDRKTG